MSTEVNEAPARSLRPAWQAVFGNGTARHSGGEAPPAFTFRVPDEATLERLLSSDPYAAAMGYLRGEFEIEGDLRAAIRFKGWDAKSSWRRRCLGALARCATLRDLDPGIHVPGGRPGEKYQPPAPGRGGSPSPGWIAYTNGEGVLLCLRSGFTDGTG